VRHLWRLDLECQGDLLETYFGGDGFLYQMVRNLMGTLVRVGRGELAPVQVAELLAGRDRTQVGPPAPPQGLCLIRVYY
jgi:tRNA pseudouridine38-40 synthase